MSDELMTVRWDEDTRRWTIDARAGADVDAWSSFEGDESELDTLLGLGRDIITGG